MGETWRFIESGARPGAENMALDQAILEAHLAGAAPPTLRVYTWRPSAVSLGRFQRVEPSVDLEQCGSLGVDVVRRPTGGRAILHTEEEVTFSIAVSERRLGTKGVMESYRALAGGIVSGLRRLGLDARLVERSAPAANPMMAQDPACFAVKARCDLVVGSAKLIGSAQVQKHGFILQQNSLPLRLPLESWQKVFRRQARPPEAAGLWEAAERRVSYAETAEALCEGLAETFTVDFEATDPSEWERDRAQELVSDVRVLEAAQRHANRAHR